MGHYQYVAFLRSSQGHTHLTGIEATGMISSWFVADLVLAGSSAKAHHIIHSIGSSSLEKGKDFAAKFCPNESPKIHASYDEVYSDPDVDCVYIGSPHGFHKRDCLKAIAAGKNILCEKAFTLNAEEAKEVIDAAKKKGVYLHEAMWLRHRPLTLDLRRMLHEEKVIGDIFRATSNFGLNIDIPSLPATSRYKDINLGAGTLLDIGIYSLTWALLTLDPHGPANPEQPKILAAQTHQEGIEVSTSAILQYPSSGRQGLISSTTLGEEPGDTVCLIEGSKGYVRVYGDAPSVPVSFTIFPRPAENNDAKPENKTFNYQPTGRGFIYEADNTALDIAAGRKESPIMPLSETLRVMEIMDEIRRQGGTRYPVDKF